MYAADIKYYKKHSFVKVSRPKMGSAAGSSTATVVTEQVWFSYELKTMVDIFCDNHFNNNTLLNHYTRVRNENRRVAKNELDTDDDFQKQKNVRRDKPGRSGDELVMVFNIGDVIAKTEQWVRLLPRVQPFYAVKCNPNEAVVKILANAMQLISPEVAARAHYTNVGYDCASKGEMEIVVGSGIPPERIIFAHPCKIISHLQYARDAGIQLITFDGLLELRKVEEFYPDAKLVLRLRVNDKKALYPLGVKFGCERSQIAPLLTVAIQLGLDVIGVSFHVGSGCHDPSAFADAIELARQAFDIGKTVGYNFTLLDIGGGFPGHTAAPIEFESTAEIVNKAVQQHFPIELYSHVRIIAEPGRYFVTSAFTLFVEVIAKKLAQESACMNEIMYYVNDGIYGSFQNCMSDLGCFKVTVPSVVTETQNVAVEKLCTIWGPTCCGLDKILEKIVLPELEIGDKLIFEDMGAYTIGVDSTFNGFLRPVVIPVCKRSTWQTIVQRRQSALAENNFKCGA